MNRVQGPGSLGRRSAVSRPASLGALALACAALAACAVDWVPSGIAQVLAWHDEEIGGVSSCVAYLEVSNVGSVRIERSSLSLRFFTASRSYYRTLVLETSIPPGALVYAEVSVAYADPSESAETEGGVELVGWFFE